MQHGEVSLLGTTHFDLQALDKTGRPVGIKVKVRDSGCKHTFFRPFSIVGPLQFSITND